HVKVVPTLLEERMSADATAKAFHDACFGTGDLASLDEDGYLKTNGRKKEIIVTSSGKNLAPAPLEDALRRHPIIGQPVVVGENRMLVSAHIVVDSEMLQHRLSH